MPSLTVQPDHGSRSRVARRHLLLAGAAWLGSGRLALAAPVSLPWAVSLQEELAQALKQQQALVVMVSLDGCPHCKVVRQNYLLPLNQQQGLPVVQVDMHSRRPLRNFRGASSTHDQMIRSWGIKLAPTVLFFGRDGIEVAQRLVGSYIPDFYGAYLDERLAQARAAVR
jgi:thioredoxin-related protein